MPVRQVRSIAVVGGGTSGWMAASYLSTVLREVQVTLIESPATPTIGVGEATLPMIRNVMERLGFADDLDWLRQCDGTYKTGILFEDWYAPGERYWHPFEVLDYIDTHTHTGHCWLALHERGHPQFRDRQSFHRSLFPSTTLNLDHGKIPYGDVGYAYHFDAKLFVDVLRSCSGTVRHVLDDVLDVRVGIDGVIESLQTRASGDIAADLFVDCTGFRGALIRRVSPDATFVSYADSLFCDRAVVIRMPYASEAEAESRMRPYVRATAQGSGWVWAIPLFTRLSSGYVYSSNHTDEGEAEETLRRLWGVEHRDDVTANQVQFRTGKLERPWVANCVAIGLSAGFIEPLESTGLAFTQIGVELLTSMLDSRSYDDTAVGRFNGHIAKAYTDVLEFIVCHYFLTGREDTPFWKAVKHQTHIPDHLAARLETFRRHLPTLSTKGTAEVWMFRDISWLCVLLGMHFPFDSPVVGEAAIREFQSLLLAKRRLVEEKDRRLATHRAFFRRRYGRAIPGSDDRREEEHQMGHHQR